jgi:uncharacterized protein YbjT (DUF2867 family)
MTVLVLGATGTIGRRVVAALSGVGVGVREASRAGPVRFDWGSPATWAPALADSSAVFLMAPDGVPVAPEFVALAVDAGVERLVLLSSGAIEEMGDSRLLSAEAVVRSSGVPEWTILRPQWFDQNFSEGFLRPAVLAGSVAVPIGDVKQGFVDAADIAAVAVAALTSPGHGGQTYALTGPSVLSFASAVAIVARAAGRSVTFDGSAAGYRAAQKGFGRPSAEVDAEVAAFAALAAMGDSTVSDDVEKVTGRPPVDFAAFADAADAAGAWSEGSESSEGEVTPDD